MKYFSLKNVFRICVSVAALIFLVGFLDWDKISSLDSSVYLTVAFASGVTLTCLMPVSARWAHLVRTQTQSHFSFWSALRGYLLGFFFSIFLPGAIGGDVLRIKYASDRTDMGLKLSGGLVVSERFFGLASTCLIFLVGLAFRLDTFFPAFDGTYFPLLFGVGLLGLISVKYWIVRRLRIGYVSYIYLIVLTLMCHLMDISAVLFVANAIGIEVDFAELMVVIPLVFIATILPISLGGLGVREATLAGLLSIVGVPMSDGILLAFLIYLAKTAAGFVGIFEALRFRKKQSGSVSRRAERSPDNVSSSSVVELE